MSEEEKDEDKKQEKEGPKRINVSAPPETIFEWKDLADEINTSVSELLRSSVKGIKPILKNLKSLKDLENLEEDLEQWGTNLEKSIKESGIAELEERIESEMGGIPKGEPKGTKSNKEVKKKRIKGLIKLQKDIPIPKLAQVLEIPEEEAENLIYELVAEGLEGTLEDNVFKFSGAPEDIIEMFHAKIERM